MSETCVVRRITPATTRTGRLLTRRRHGMMGAVTSPSDWLWVLNRAQYAPRSAYRAALYLLGEWLLCSLKSGRPLQA
jgi:hypothetical protein